MDWNFKVVSGNRCPRQFEYHPSKHGEVCAIDIYNGESAENTSEELLPSKPAPIKSLGYFGKSKTDTMLGLCWLRPHITDDASTLYGGNRATNNLFLSGSSKGRVCLGDASRAFDPANPDSFGIVHDYPVFDKLTSIHVNSTNQLLLMSGYATGVNLVDVETSQVVRKFENIHRDHVNISRFSNLSPHLFATSSFDATIKTWDLRQSGGASPSGSSNSPATDRPVYTVHCQSGVVMINFSVDDQFILASALDNEINQYLFLDGRKHLSYNLPRTGLKSNFTRAYYSASGRHTLTGACEERTVKIMCTYTGEPVTTVDLYPGKKDSSIYIQSLRGCPSDEDQICVLANYRDIQTRELIIVTRNHRTHRAAALDAQQLPARCSSEKNHARSVASWFSGGEVAVPVEGAEKMNTTASSSTPHYPPAQPMHAEAYASDVSLGDASMQSDGYMADAGHDETHQHQHQQSELQEEEEEYQPNNSLMCFYSTKYLEDMRQLCRGCAGLVHTYEYAASDASSSSAVGASAGEAGRLTLHAREGTEVRSCTDLVVLVHRAAAGAGRESGGLFVLPVHTFVLQARCPELFALCARRQGGDGSASSQSSLTEADLVVTNSTGEVVCLSVPALDLSAEDEAGASVVPVALLPLLPLVVDYLYTGVKALDALTVRYYCLQQLVREDSEGHTLAAILAPLVDELLQAEITDFSASGSGSKKRDRERSDSEDEMLLADEGTGASQCLNRTATMFFPVHDSDSVELLLKVCVDDPCWRQSSTLATRYADLVRQLLQLSQRLQLGDAVDALSSLLERGLCPLNALRVYDIAVEFRCTQLVHLVLRFLAAHYEVVRSQLERRPDIAAAVADLSAPQMANVLARSAFRDLKAAAAVAAGGGSSADSSSKPSPVAGSTLNALSVFLNNGSNDSDDESDSEDGGSEEDVEAPGEAIEDFWQLEELPYLPAQEASTSAVKGGVAVDGSAKGLAPGQTTRAAAVCLPRYISVSVAPFLQDSVVFLGGQNLDRLHTYRNRVLTYNYEEDVFRYLSAGGSRLPKCGYMSCASALQRRRPTHIVALGGKIKKAEISVQHSTLPQHLRTMNGVADTLWRKLAPRSLLSGEEGAATWNNLVGMSVDSTGPVSVVYNRLIDVWNLNADREELSQPTAEAYAAQVGAALNSLNSTVDAEGNEIRFPKAQKLMKSMGLVYELDCETLTWRSPSVEIGPVTQVNAFNPPSASLQLLQDGEIKAQRVALERRVAQAVAPLCPEDVAYRRCDCLFSTYPALPCTCSAAKANTSGTTSSGGEEVQRSWLVQFGGFCDQNEIILDDLHVLTCERRVPSAAAPGKEASTSTTAQCQYQYTYKWSCARASGDRPSARFSHSMLTVPARPSERSPSTTYLPVTDHTRIIVYGGTCYNVEDTELASLRINRSALSSSPRAVGDESAHYVHWEPIDVNGALPAPTASHTMVHIPGTELCVHYGGAYTGAQGERRNHCNPHTHILKLVGVRRKADATTELVVRWTRLSIAGIPPSLRSRHCSFAVTRRGAEAGSAEVMIFGGVDEDKLSRRQPDGGSKLSDLDSEVKDSVMHTLQLRHEDSGRATFDPKWLQRSDAEANANASATLRYSQLLYFRTDPSVQLRECTLSRDMLQLLDAFFVVQQQHWESEGAMDVATTTTTPEAIRMQQIVSEFLAQRGVPTVPVGGGGQEEGIVPTLEPHLTLDLVNTDGGGSPITSPFTLHESLLCTRCAWFTTLLTSNMQGGGGGNTSNDAEGGEDRDASCKRVSLFEVDPVAFRLLLVYVYADALMICSLQDVVAVLELANQFDLSSLALQCEGVLVRLTTLDNVCELLDYADTLNLGVLKAACIALLLRDVVVAGEAKGRPYAAAMFAGLPAPSDGSVLAVCVLDAEDVRSQLVADFQSLSADLRSEVWALYRQDAQVYGMAVTGEGTSS